MTEKTKSLQAGSLGVATKTSTTTPDTPAHTPLPCPFCGGSVQVYKAFPAMPYPWAFSFGHGEDCPLMGWDGLVYTTEAEAIAAWNTRTHSDSDLVEALREARRIIAEIDDYMNRPERGDWGTECALCMGELLDDDRDALARIDAALSQAGGASE